MTATQTSDLRTHRPTRGAGPAPTRYRPDIEGLRAVAVVLVVVFHTGVDMLPGGFVGVDVFFVLSGFLITGLLLGELRRTGTISLRDFYARRIRRLLPLSTVVLVVTALAGFLVVGPLDRTGLGIDVAAAALYAANWNYALAATQYMADTEHSPVLHFWSLSVEEQFYVVWPLMLLVAAGRTALAVRRWPIVRRRIVLALAVLGGASLLASALTTRSDGPFAYFGLHTRAWELAVGAALAVVATRIGRLPRPVAAALGWLGLLTIGLCALVMDGDTVFPGTAAAYPVLGAALLITAGAVAPTAGAGRLLSHPVPRYLGRISYAWYLWHWPCLVLTGAVRAAADPEQATGAAPVTPRLVAALALSLLLAVFSHHWIEQPVRHWAWLAGDRRRSLALGAALTAVSALAGAGLLVQGAAGDGARMSAATARKDRPTGTTGCYVFYADDAVRDPCVFGDPAGSRTVALIGDSHAEHWFPALDAWARQHGWRLHLWAKSSCPVADTEVWLNRFNGPYDSCTRWRAALLKRLGTLPRLDAVVVGRSRGYRTMLLTDRRTRVTPAQVEPAWRAAMGRSVQALAGTGATVVLLRDVPNPGFDVPACISEAPHDPAHCGFPRDPAADLTGPLDRAEEAVLARHRTARFLDLTDVLCPGPTCPVYDARGAVLYRDSHHLTATYAASLRDVVGGRLEALLPPAAGAGG